MAEDDFADVGRAVFCGRLFRGEADDDDEDEAACVPSKALGPFGGALPDISRAWDLGIQRREKEKMKENGVDARGRYTT